MARMTVAACRLASASPLVETVAGAVEMVERPPPRPGPRPRVGLLPLLHHLLHPRRPAQQPHLRHLHLSLVWVQGSLWRRVVVGARGTS